MTIKKIANNARTIEERDEIIVLSYYLVSGEITVSYEGEELILPSYGIEVMSETYRNGKKVDEGRERYENISPYCERVVELINHFADMFLSPVHLIDIMEERIEEYIEDFDRVIQKISRMAI
ncbi:DUF6514 family protein [Calorimonas adulescens]|jgi:hypothetical protein|uniref:Uncharacterized protein n=1 Tax=Calorimonas adulescens TaxID=2606906 RepID=A0A5D8QAB8_9THEO|nr:DUF6514 family protein [Calorimonas adulescens]TZE81079.1 hypothetical protein FWJ32_10685 [Calorimonas adulescens]